MSHVMQPRQTQPLDKHYTASVIIVTDTQPRKALVVHHRKFNKWMQPGGHQEAHENPIEAAAREVLEETGLDISAYLPPSTPLDNDATMFAPPHYLLEERIDPYGDQPLHYHLDQIYVVRIPEQSVAHNQREAHDIRWVTAKELATLPTFKNVTHLITQELAK